MIENIKEKNCRFWGTKNQELLDKRIKNTENQKQPKTQKWKNKYLKNIVKEEKMRPKYNKLQK